MNKGLEREKPNEQNVFLMQDTSFPSRLVVNIADGSTSLNQHCFNVLFYLINPIIAL